MAGPILIAGATGQLGQALARRGAQRGLHLAGRAEIDFERPAAIPPFLETLAPRAIVNAAAYTAVDKAETDIAAAYRANRDGPEILACYAAQAGIPFLHVSTDYVFDGAKGAPYVETDATSPTGIYGASKRAGEDAVLALGGENIILRTAWVYAPWGRNFLRTMLAAGAKSPKMRVVADQIGCPTLASDLAAAIWSILDKIDREGWRSEFGGIYHAVGGGETSWHGFATAIFEESGRHGGTVPEVEAIRTADWPTPAKRPADSRLDCGKLAQAYGIILPHWREALVGAIDAYYSGGGS
jgi:dTDP-4-dehydrorhamnose reductase